MPPRPYILTLAGPNGAGKTTISRAVVAESAGLSEFVNADIIAQGLSGFDPERAAFAAGRIMLARLRELAAARSSFAFESTLASRTFAPWIATLTKSGYEFRVVYVWLRSPELAIRRVNARVRKGGHAVPPDTIRRRYARSISNFCSLYLPLATTWRVYDNSSGFAAPVARRARNDSAPEIFDRRAWEEIQRIAHDQAQDPGTD